MLDRAEWKIAGKVKNCVSSQRIRFKPKISTTDSSLQFPKKLEFFVTPKMIFADKFLRF